ncbi:MAG: hypothetical protein P1V35_02490 [Planctomycetota bacterium]|nr:hypothetical protein [Planctomycetota bacterium]
MSQFNPAGPSRPSPAPARLAIFLCLAWLLMGALAKLFTGSPNDLPKTILELSPLSTYDTFRGAIAAEICIAAIALIWPRLGWMFLTAIYVVFIGVLSQLIADGAKTCGCGGSSVSIAPWVMMTIDGVLLLLLLASRPWKTLPKTNKAILRAITLAPIFVIAFILPWTYFIEVVIPPEAPPAGPNGTETTAAIESDVIDGFKEFRMEEWEGQMIFDIELGQFTDPAGSLETLPAPLHVIIYRKSCEHCQEHIAELATNPTGEIPIALVRVPEIDDDNAPDVIELKPEGHFPIELRKLSRGYGIPTPSSFDIGEDFMVTNVMEIKHDH